MVSYSKFKECHLALSSLKRNIAAFLDKLEIDALLRHYFFITVVCCFFTWPIMPTVQCCWLIPLGRTDINLITAAYILARRIHTIHCTDLQTKTSHFWLSNKGLFLDIVFKNMMFIFGILRHYSLINLQMCGVCVCWSVKERYSLFQGWSKSARIVISSVHAS